MPFSWMVAGMAGMVSAFNPCGIALLPSYLMYLLSGRIQQRKFGWLDGLRAGLLMTLGFVILFGVAGLLVTSAGILLFGATRMISILLALMIFILAIFVWRGQLHVGISTNRVSTLLESMFARGSSGSFFAYGVGFGLASLSCSLPVFLSVASQGFAAGFRYGLLIFFAYSMGMGFIITILSILATSTRTLLETFLHIALPYVQKLSAIVMVIAGVYLLWYWLLGPQGLLI